jgi:hypothetical protein
VTGTRPLASVSRWSACFLVAALAAQLHWHSTGRGAETRAAADLPAPPSAQTLRAASLGEPELAARIAMLYLQAFDLSGENPVAYAQLDYRRLAGWLNAILETDPRSAYPLFSAARVYAEVADPDKCRVMLDFVSAAFGRDPDRRWPWLAHAALLAKHRLNDLQRALAYARAIERHAGAAAAPRWARQMQAFLLEDLNELEAAKIVLGGLVATGHAADPRERRFLQARLDALERRLAAR